MRRDAVYSLEGGIIDDSGHYLVDFRGMGTTCCGHV